MNILNRRLWAPLLIAAVPILGACGGGGGSTASVAPPPVTPPAAVKGIVTPSAVAVVTAKNAN